jgi:lipopolysaccharide transport system ATP-binding protein
MGRREIQRKFDEIVEFAETGAFLDTPVKRYSSGMYVRLAFAVAAHLEPEVLIVDEVLAVGDAAFQKKSLGKMNDAARSGRTVLFVSHNMAAVENLCSRAIVLADGSIEFEGATPEAVSHYLRTVNTAVAAPLAERTDRRGVGGLRVTSLEVRRALDGAPASVVASGDDIEIALGYEVEPGFSAREPVVGIAFLTENGSMMTSVHNKLTGDAFPALGERGAFVCALPRLPLAPATYRIAFSVRRSSGDWEYLDSLEGAAELTVVEGDFYSTGVSPPPSTGFALVDASWRLEDA